jgi:hypothetical protein
MVTYWVSSWKQNLFIEFTFTKLQCCCDQSCHLLCSIQPLQVCINIGLCAAQQLQTACAVLLFCITKFSVYSTARAYHKELHSLHSDIIPDRSLSLSFPSYTTMSCIVLRCISPLSHLIPPTKLQRTTVALSGWYIHTTISSFHADTTSFWNGELLFWVDVVGSLRRLNHPIIVTTLGVYKKQLTKWYI